MNRDRRRFPTAALGALAVLAGSLTVSATATAAAATAPASTGTAVGPSLTLVSQPTGVELDGRATFTVRVAGAPDDAELDATVFPPTTVDGVREAEQGRLPERQLGFVPRAALSTLAGPDGTASITLRAVGAPPRFDDEVRMSAAGVYPVRLRLLAAGGDATLAALVTFLVRPEGRKLPVTVVLPLPGSPTLHADGTTTVSGDDQDHALAVTQLLTALPDFPFALAPRPDLLSGLSRTNPVLTSRLSAALGARAVLSMPQVRLDVRGMAAAGLSAEVGRQLTLGEQMVAQALPGTRPDRRVWYADGPLDDASLALLRTLGVQHLLTTAARLDPTVASPTLHPVRLSLATDARTAANDDSTGLGALVGDTDVSARIAPMTDVAGSVVNLVAELSARAFGNEVGRGLVVLPSRDWTVVPEFWTRFAAALRGPGVLTAVDLDEFLRTTTPVRDQTYRVRPTDTRDELRLAQSLYVTRVALAQLGSVLPAQSTRFEGLADRTTTATSADLTDDQRQAYFDAVTARVNPVRTAVTVRVRDRVTLAGKNGVVPLSLVNTLDEAVTVRLQLASNKVRVTDNPRVVQVPAHGEVPLRLKVEARSSAWQFPVSIQLSTPDGSEPLGAAVPLELRAVGLSGLGLGISFGALAVLATWWITHARRRRRAGRAEPPPTTTLAHP